MCACVLICHHRTIQTNWHRIIKLSDSFCVVKIITSELSLNRSIDLLRLIKKKNKKNQFKTIFRNFYRIFFENQLDINWNWIELIQREILCGVSVDQINDFGIFCCFSNWKKKQKFFLWSDRFVQFCKQTHEKSNESICVKNKYELNCKQNKSQLYVRYQSAKLVVLVILYIRNFESQPKRRRKKEREEKQ